MKDIIIKLPCLALDTAILGRFLEGTQSNN